MVMPIVRALLERRPPSTPVSLVPCTVTSVSPLLVSIFGATGIPAVAVAGAVYTVGAPASALYSSPGKPIILPIGQ